MDRGISNHQNERRQDLGGACGKFFSRLSAVRCQTFMLEIAMARHCTKSLRHMERTSLIRVSRCHSIAILEQFGHA
jgi:hypothetical protein